MLHGKAGGAEECSAAHGIIKRNLMCLVSLFRSQMHYTSRVFKDTTSIGKAPLCHSSDLSKGRCSRVTRRCSGIWIFCAYRAR